MQRPPDTLQGSPRPSIKPQLLTGPAHMYIYVYTYVCVRACVCVCIYYKTTTFDRTCAYVYYNVYCAYLIYAHIDTECAEYTNASSDINLVLV